MSAWASTADVTSLTAATVTDAQLAQAQAVVELHAGRTFDATTRMGSRDVEWLRRAVAYQAVWQLGQGDVFSRLDFTQVGKDKGTPVGITETGMTLAPLARQALRRVSWLRSRSLHVRAPFEDGPGPGGGIASGLTDASDASQAWGAF